jgi:hypothetical protein
MTKETAKATEKPGAQSRKGFTVDQILRDAEIADLINQNQKVADDIKRAAELLRDERDAIAAVKKAARGLLDKKVSVFFSYKQKDENTAGTVVKELRKACWGDYKLQITYAADFEKEKVGYLWNEAIRDGIKNAHWFILLLPDPSADWDWCLFETGMFRGQMVSGDRLICLHHPNIKLPPQIEEFQAVKAEQGTVQNFLRQIFLEENPIPGVKAINKEVGDDIPDIAGRIVRAIRPPKDEITRKYYGDYVSIKVENPKELEGLGALNAATVVASKPDSLRIFGKDELPNTWGELVSNVSESGSDTRWIADLCKVIKEAADNNVFEPIQATFQAVKGGKMYRPLLHAADKTADGDIEAFHIIFIEEVGAVDITRTPEGITAVATVLRYAYRFRWEVIEKFSKRDMTEDDVAELAEALKRIEIDAQSRGLINPDLLISQFEGEEKGKIINMFADWYKLRNDKRNGALDIAMHQRNVREIQRILGELSHMNREFMDLALRRFTEVMSETVQ